MKIKGTDIKKKLALSLAVFLVGAVGFSACSANPENSEDAPSSTDYIVPTRLKQTESGRVYIEKNGEPLLYTGAHIRVDGYTHFQERTFEEREEQFACAAELGVQTVQVQILWGDIEKQKDVYDFRQLRTMLEWAQKYDLSLDLLMGNPMECHWYLPDYIYEDEQTYPKYQTSHKNAYWWNGYHGTMVYDNPNLLDRQRKFLLAVGDYLYNWENNNGNPNIVVSYGINNEPDGFPRYTLSEYQVCLPDGSRRLLEDEAWDALYVALESTADAYKDSKYRALTRVNLIKLWDNEYGIDTYATRIYEMDSIDMIGDDTYTESLVSQEKAMNNLMTGTFADNMPHVAENSGNFKNTASLFLSAITQGAGYLIYCLALPEGYVDPNDAAYDYWEQGLYAPDWSEKEHVQSVKDIIHGVNKAGSQFAVADLDNMIGFNLSENYPQTETSEEMTLDNRTISYRTTNGGLAYAVYYKGYTTVLSTEDCELAFSGDELTTAEMGSFDGFTFNKEGEEAMEDNTLSLQANVCYRILTNPSDVK